MRLKNNLILLLSIVILASCKKETEEPVEHYYEYFPVDIGKYTIFTVTKIVHDDAVNMHDTITYKMKQLIESTFVDNQGRPSVRIELYRKDVTHPSWTIDSVWYATRLTTRVEQIENDEKFIKLIFPVNETGAWNGNSFNTQQEWEYEYEDAHEARTYGALNFPSTAKVLQRYNHNFIEFQHCFEVYAEGVGLVQKYYKNFTIINGDTTKPNLGYEYHVTVLEYGQQ